MYFDLTFNPHFEKFLEMIEVLAYVMVTVSPSSSSTLIQKLQSYVPKYGRK